MIESRIASASDIPLLAELWYERALLHQLRLAPDARERWSSSALTWLDNPDVGIFTAIQDGRLLGYIVGRIEPAPPGLLDTWQGIITEIAIDAHQYHAGVGRLLAQRLRDWFLTRNIEQILIVVPQRSPVEQAVWRGLGAVKRMEVLWIK